MKRTAWIFLLRFAAFVLDLVGRQHNIRRRLGQLQRVRKMGYSGVAKIAADLTKRQSSLGPEINEILSRRHSDLLDDSSVAPPCPTAAAALSSTQIGSEHTQDGTVEKLQRAGTL